MLFGLDRKAATDFSFFLAIPTLNEAAHIEALIRQLLGDAPPELAAILVADGGSTDGTREIVAALAQSEPRVRLVDNPLRLQAAGVNRAAAAADPGTTMLVRLDAHAGYRPGFIANLATALTETGADSVVVRLHTQGDGCFQKAVAAVSNSPLGTGGAAHRMGGASRWIEHGHHAAFGRDRFLALGGYDETFAANEDAEFDVRLRRAGGRIWFAADLEVDYYPRRTPLKLARQYFRYGKGRARNLLKNGERLKPRQLAPPALVIGLVLTLATTVVTPLGWLPTFAYLGAALVAGAAMAMRGRDACLLLAAVALPVMHLAWGAGFLIALVGGVSNRWGVRAS